MLGLGPLGSNSKYISNLWLVVACAGLGGAWDRLCCELRLVASCSGLGTLDGCHIVSWGQLCPFCPAGDCLVEAMFQVNTGHRLRQAWIQFMGVTIQVETGRHLCWVCGCLESMPRPVMLIWGLWTFEKFWESLQAELRQAACAENLLRGWDWVSKLGEGRWSQGFTGAGNMVLARLMASTYLVPAR